MEKIIIQLTASDVKRGIIRPTDYKEKFQKKDHIYINNNKVKVTQNGTRITRLTKLHHDNQAEPGMYIELIQQDEDRYTIKYDVESRCTPKKTKCTNDPTALDGIKRKDEQELLLPIKISDDKTGTTEEKSIQNDPLYTAFYSMVYDYALVIKNGFIPTRDNIGFTERNLTYYLCHNYQINNKEAIIWQELPIIGFHQHLDSIIIHKDKESKIIDIFFIESKRIYNKNYVCNDKNLAHGSLKQDYIRLKSLITSKDFPNNTPGLSALLKDDYTTRKHIVLLASLEYLSTNFESTFNERKDAIVQFSEEDVSYEGDIKKEKLSCECLSILKEENNSLLIESDSFNLKSLHFSIMTETIQ